MSGVPVGAKLGLDADDLERDRNVELAVGPLEAAWVDENLLRTQQLRRSPADATRAHDVDDARLGLDAISEVHRVVVGRLLDDAHGILGVAK